MNKRKLIGWLALVAVCGLAVYMVLGDYGLKRYYELKAELHRLTEQNRELRRTNEELELQVRLLTEDGRAIEKAIRHELGYVKKGEMVVFFKEHADEESSDDEAGGGQ